MKRLCVAAGVLMLAAAAAGQVREPQRFDSAPIVQGLQNPGTREQTAAQLATVPANALAPLAEAAADDSTPSAARDALNAALPRMYERLRTERHKQDQTLDDAWTQRQLLEAYKNGPAGGKAMAEVEPALRSIATGRADYTVLKAAVDAETAAGVKPDDPAIHVAYVLAGLTSSVPKPDA